MPKQARSQATYAALLNAAESLFAAQGYNAVSVEAICRTAGVSKGAFYHHFGSKQAVFLALLQRWLTRLEQRLQKERRAGPGLAGAQPPHRAALGYGAPPLPPGAPAGGAASPFALWERGRGPAPSTAEA